MTNGTTDVERCEKLIPFNRPVSFLRAGPVSEVSCRFHQHRIHDVSMGGGTERRGNESNVSGSVISYIYEAVKDKVSTLRLHHRHFKSRLPARKSL